MTQSCYKWRQEELGWILRPENKAKAIQAMMDILDDPKKNARAKTMAFKNLLQAEAQNITLSQPEVNQDNNLQITISHQPKLINQPEQVMISQDKHVEEGKPNTEAHAG